MALPDPVGPDTTTGCWFHVKSEAPLAELSATMSPTAVSKLNSAMRLDAQTRETEVVKDVMVDVMVVVPIEGKVLVDVTVCENCTPENIVDMLVTEREETTSTNRFFVDVRVRVNCECCVTTTPCMLEITWYSVCVSVSKNKAGVDVR